MDRAYSTHGGRGEVPTGSWWGDLREGVHLEDPGLDGGILNWIFKKWCVGALTRLIWLMTGTGRRFR